MLRAVLLVPVALMVGACGGEGGASDLSAATTEPSDERFVLRTSVTIAATSGAEQVATGEVLEGSTIGDSSFCVGGTILDVHANLDPAVERYGLLARKLTCPDGIVKMGFTPEVAQGPTGTGSWTIVSGTGAFEGLGGSGEFEITYDPDDDALASETYTGTVTR